MKTHRDSDKAGLYRSRNGAILGVCRGLAEYFDFSVFWARAISISGVQASEMDGVPSVRYSAARLPRCVVMRSHSWAT